MRLDMSVRTWTEFRLESECQEASDYIMNRYRGTDDKPIYIRVALNAETNMLVLTFAEYRTNFTENAQKMFAEIENRLKTKFGENRVVVIDGKTGKYALEESLLGRHKSLPMCLSTH